MMQIKKWWVPCVAVFGLLHLCGRVYAEDFREIDENFFIKYLQQTKLAIDTSAPAVVLYDFHKYDIEKATLTVRRIIKILKKSGAEYANIMLTVPGIKYSGPEVKSVHGYTYNLENGKVVKQLIDADNISDEETRDIKEKKVIMPAVRDGSVIDCSYEIAGVSPNFAMWYVQEDIPKLFGKMELVYPKELDFEANDPNIPMFIILNDEQRKKPDSLLPYSYTYKEPVLDNTTSQTWVRKNIKAFEDEPYISSRSNYCEKLTVYLNSFHLMYTHTDLYSWDKINTGLLKMFFDKPLLASEQAIKQKARELAGDQTDNLATAKRIFRYVCDSISYNGTNDIFNETELSKVMENKSGSSSEKNMLLLAMLRYAGLKCCPVILATRDNGTPSATKPDLPKYDYTICRLTANQHLYYLDATQKYYPFGVLPSECLNGYARAIDKTDSGGIMLSRDMAANKEMYMVTTRSDDPAHYSLNFKCYYGVDNGVKFRKEWQDKEEVVKYIKKIFREFPQEIKIEDHHIEHLNEPDEPLALDFTISFTWPDNQLYLNPYVFKFFNENPFKSPERAYDIDMPGTENLVYICKMKLPKGYQIEDVPQAGVVQIGEKTEYKNFITYDKENNQLNIDARLQMPVVHFNKDDYNSVKQFFEKMMEEQQATLVIKKQS